MYYFFRGQTDGWNFPRFGWIHILILAGYSIFLVGFLRSKWSTSPNRKNKVCVLLMLPILFDQILRYGWIFYNNLFTLQTEIPLYHCRITFLIALIALWKKKEPFVTITVYWGMFGGILSLLVPDPYKYQPLHFTNISFFVSHFILLLTAFYFVKTGYIFNKKSFRIISIFTFLYTASVACVNLLLDSNYGYTKKSPIATKFIQSFGPWASIFFALLVPLLASLIIYYVGKKLQTKTSKTNYEI